MDMYDSKKLLQGLIAYHKSLKTHLNQLGSEYVQLSNRWQMFNSVAEGNYADQFRLGWLKTDTQFKAYNVQSLKMKSFLDERIEFLAKLNRENLEIYNQYTSWSSNTTKSLDTPEALESLSNSHSWNIDEQTLKQLEQFYSLKASEDKNALSKYIGETYGNKMVCDILGYIPILQPEDKYDSFPQGLDGIYLDSEETIVVTEFKGQGSDLSELQKMENYASYVCTKIVEGKDSPYTNAPQEEREFARQILREIENGANVRYEVYRTQFDPKSQNLFTSLEKRYFPELVNLSSKNSENKAITRLPGVLGEIEGNEKYQAALKKILDFKGSLSERNLMPDEREEVEDKLSNTLKNFAQEVYPTLNRIQKAKVTRALNKLNPPKLEK